MDGPTDADNTPITTIQRRHGWISLEPEQLWRYRSLLWMLAARDVKVRYKQTVVGVCWAILQPVMTMVVFTTIFTLIGWYPSTGNVPYPLTLFCALLPWQLFATSLAQSGESLITNQQLITKIYFPRLLIPMAPILVGLLDLAITLVVLVGMVFWYGLTPSWAILTLPLFVLLTASAALALGLWLSALNALYRDFRYALPFLIQLGYFASPVIYESAALKLSPTWQAVYALNPMVGAIDGFRWALVGGAAPPWLSIAVSSLATVILMLTGMIYFRRMERTFADWV